jgi:hypothetical protein
MCLVRRPTQKEEKVTKQIINVNFRKKPGKIRVVIGKETKVFCRVHYLEYLDYDRGKRMWSFHFWYPDRIDPVPKDDRCYDCEIEEREAREQKRKPENPHPLFVRRA